MHPRSDLLRDLDALRDLAAGLIEAGGLRGLMKGSTHFELVACVLDYAAGNVDVLPALVRKTINGMTPEDESQWLKQMSVTPGLWDEASQPRAAQTRVVDEVRNAVASELDLALCRAFNALLPRPEIAAFNEFSAEAGRKFFENALIPLIFPSKLWRAIDRGEGPTFLAEVASKLWRVPTMQNRIRRTEEQLDRGEVLDQIASVGALSGQQYLKTNEIVTWWLRKETLATRYYLAGLLGFPESFLALLRGRDVKYDDELTSFLPNDVERKARKRAKEYRQSANGDVAQILAAWVNGIGLHPKVLLGRPNYSDFTAAHRRLRVETTEEDVAALAFVFKDIRNSLIHGLNFRVDGDCLLFEHRGNQCRVRHDASILAFHLLPAVLGLILRKSEVGSD